jgi:hypothetical protein
MPENRPSPSIALGQKSRYDLRGEDGAYASYWHSRETSLRPSDFEEASAEESKVRPGYFFLLLRLSHYLRQLLVQEKYMSDKNVEPFQPRPRGDCEAEGIRGGFIGLGVSGAAGTAATLFLNAVCAYQTFMSSLLLRGFSFVKLWIRSNLIV